MTKLSSKILRKIKEGKVTPKSRWYFIFIHILLGTAILTSIMIGGMAVAIIIRHCAATDWEMADRFSNGPVRSFFLIIPYIWFILIGITIFFADTLFKYTKKGYRVKLWQIITASVALSIILGSIFFFTKADRPVEEGLRTNVESYAEWIEKRNRLFADPEKGILAGKIIFIEPNQVWELLDFHGKEWLVETSNAANNFYFNAEAGMYVGMIGEMISQNHFRALRINPWRIDMHQAPPPIMKNIKMNERKIRQFP